MPSRGQQLPSLLFSLFSNILLFDYFRFLTQIYAKTFYKKKVTYAVRPRQLHDSYIIVHFAKIWLALVMLLATFLGGGTTVYGIRTSHLQLLVENRNSNEVEGLRSQELGAL